MNADFSASITAGCAPLYVNFKDLTTGDPKFWNWDFGNGTLSNAQNPFIGFNTPGTYTVKLVVRNADGTTGITKTDYITVYPSPSASFDANIKTGCVPVNVQFADQSTSPNGGITAWQWNFGDGTTSTAQNPQKSYTTTGFYDVSLTVTSSTGCKSTLTGSRYIRIVSGIKPEFDNSKALSCQAPYNIDYTNLSTGPGNLMFQWDLGNGVTSTDAAPSTTYNTAGTYNVTLTATSDFGCTGSITKPVTLTGPVTTFTVVDTTCQNSHVWFENKSTVTPTKTVWDFGNGDQSFKISDSTVYTTPGTYTIKMYNTYTGCTDSATKQLVVLPSPLVDFTASNAAACKGPLTVQFADASPAGPAPFVSWQWDFGDGGTGTGATTSHTYTNDGIYDVSIYFMDARGCPGKITKPSVVKVVKPVASITNVPDGGCAPFTFAFKDTVIAVDNVVSWQWDFGDGQTGSTHNPTHTYNNTGNYNVTLTATTAGGCTSTTTVTDAIKTGVKPQSDFSMSETDACASETITFTDLTPQPPTVDYWQWDFGDGDGLSGPTQNPDHKYKDTGTFVVQLYAYNNKCPGVVASKTIHIKPAVAKFTYTVDCSTLAVTFTDKSIVDPAYGAISYTWDFGDGSPVVTSPTATSPVHPYALGTYSAKLTVSNGSCADTYIANVIVVREVANFTIPAVACKKASVIAIATNDPSHIRSYEWQQDGGTLTPGGANFDASFATNGSHTIGLRVTDVNGCISAITQKTVSITSPAVTFTASAPGGCKNAIISFTDASSSPNPPVNKWTFDFGDGKTASYTSAPFSHQYTDTGEYVVQLTVEDALGCRETDTLADTLFISTPKAWFNANYTTVCPASDVTFTDSSSGKGLTYKWDFGNGGTSTQQNPVYSYGGNNASYSVKLIVIDRGGCTDTVTRSNYIKTIKPIPAFDIADTVTICPPIETKFTLRASDYESFEWDFGDGYTSILTNPTHFYNNYGDFTAKLYVKGFGGCIDSASHMVHVYNPGAVTTINYGPLDSCNHITVDFTITTAPGIKFSFGFGDGTIDSSMATTYQHVYSSPAVYVPSVTYTDGQGCIAGVAGGNAIKVVGADPFFGLDKKKFCDSGMVYLTNYTIGNDPVVTRTWDFGDGTATSSDESPSHYYTFPGTFLVSQTVTTQAGCTKTVTDSVKVFRTPDPIIAGDSIACINAAFTLRGTLAVPDTAITWNWHISNGITSSNQNLPINFKQSGNYTAYLQATNSFGCTDSTHKDLYIPPTPAITIVNNPTIPVGSGISLPVVYGPNIASYLWTPAKNLDCTDCATPYANPKSTTTYNVQVMDTYGCTNTSNITVNVVCSNLNYFLPNTFTPNGDGMNDVFAPRGTGLTRVNSMRIFNRWGELVFEKINFVANDRTPTGGWDGTYKGKPASADVYVYIVEFVCENSAIVPVKGNVALVR